MLPLKPCPPAEPSPVRPPRPSSAEPHLQAAAALLAEMAAQVEALGARLCTDPAVVARHITELQAIDLIAQKQLHLSELLLADCPHAAVEQMRVEDVKQRIGNSLRCPK